MRKMLKTLSAIFNDTQFPTGPIHVVQASAEDIKNVTELGVGGRTHLARIEKIQNFQLWTYTYKQIPPF